MNKKPLYSAKPGDIKDSEGNPRPSYLGKPKSVVRNFDKYGDIQYSESRRQEIKREMAMKMMITAFMPEIKAEIRLLKKKRVKDTRNMFFTVPNRV